MTLCAAHVSAFFGRSVSEPLATRLLASDRLASRLHALLERRLDRLPQLDARQARMLAMDTHGVAALSRQAGVVWHAGAIAALVDGAAVRALVAAIGGDLRLLALRGLTLAQPAEAATPEAIAAAIPEVGAGCLAAWCSAQPSPIAEHLVLRFPPGPPPSRQAAGAAIVAWLLEEPA